MGGHAMSEQELKKHVRGYFIVFGTLLALTIVTVAISYLHLPTWAAILLALVVASGKASLVCLYFMHLISEKTVIYWVLGLTLVIFLFCMLIPIFLHYGNN
jgi:cytochrome c oxidase subunit IV